MPKRTSTLPYTRAIHEFRRNRRAVAVEDGLERVHELLATSARKPFDSDLDYLQAELEWIKSRCVWLGARRSLTNSQRHPESPFEDARSKAAQTRENRKRLTRYAKLDAEIRKHVDKRRAANVRANKTLALDTIVESYGLSEIERTALLLATGYALSSSFNRYLGMVGGEDCYMSHASPTVDVLFNFLDFDLGKRVRHRHLLSASSKMISEALISIDEPVRALALHQLAGVAFELTPETFDRLLGDDALGDVLREFSALQEPLTELSEVVLPEQHKSRLLAVVENHERYLEVRKDWGVDEYIRYGRGIVMLFHGRPGTGKTMTAHGIARHLGKKVLNVDIPTFIAHYEDGSFLPQLFRAAKASNAILFFDECETLFAARELGNSLMTLLLTEIERFEGIAILATNMPNRIDEALLRRVLIRMEFPEPDASARAAIWRKHLPSRGVLSGDIDVEALATRFEASGGYIKNAILTAVAAAVHRDAAAPMLDHTLLESAMADQIRLLDGGGERMEATNVSLGELVLPATLREQVLEIIDAARSRRTVFETWGIGATSKRGRGLSALFHGDSGTGKTMAAEVIAHELGRPLMRCDAQSVLSKYIGESEQRLADIFKEAKASSAVLLIDEADGLLRARGTSNGSDVHGEKLVATFLQLIERHDGVTILTTNLGSLLDPALERRFMYCLRFPVPDAAAREQIWRSLLPPTVPRDGELDLASLASRFEAAGGFIRNAVIKAAQRAARAGTGVSQRLLETAALEVMPRLTKGKRVAGFEHN